MSRYKCPQDAVAATVNSAVHASGAAWGKKLSIPNLMQDPGSPQRPIRTFASHPVKEINTG